MNTSIKALLLYVGFVGLLGCGEEVAFPPEPVISLVSITPDTAQEYIDSITFTISYQDGDGDLGENDAQVTNLFITDNRIGITYPYRVSQLAPDGETIAIQGNIKIILPNTGITDASTEQSVTFDIFVIDRAGNKSNVITTTPITVVK